MKKMIEKIWNKYENLSLPVRAGIWFTICNFLQRGISVITVPIFTRLLSTLEYGNYSMYLSWFNIMTVVTTLNLASASFNNAMLKFQNKRDQYVSAMQGITVTLTCIWFLIYIVFRQAAESIIEMPSLYIMLMFIELMVSSSMSFWLSRCRFEYKYQRVVSVTLLKSALNPVLGLILVWFSNQKDLARIISGVIIECIFCIPIMIYQFAKGKVFFQKEMWGFALSFNIPLLLHYLSNYILNQADKVMISKMIGNAEVAIYSVAYNIGMLIQMVTTAIVMSVTPWIYIKLKEKTYEGMASRINSLLMVVAVLSVAPSFVAPEMVNIFATKEYSNAAYIIPPVSASVFFIFLYNMLSCIEFYYEKKKYTVISSASVAGLNVLLNWIFINWFGYIAAGYTTLACYMVYALFHYVVCYIICKTEMKHKMIYDTKVIAQMSFAVPVICILTMILYPYPIVRSGILVIILTVAFIRRKDLIDLLKV